MVYSILLANFSTIPSVVNIDRGLEAFVNLRKEYKEFTHCGCSWKPSSFSNAIWIRYIFIKHQRSINDYKLGRLSTAQFLQKLREVFDFLETAEFNQAIKDEIWSQREELYSLKEIHEQSALTQEHLINALVEQAWNAILDFHSDDYAKFEKLWALAQAGQEVYFISNTNELNIHKMLIKLQKNLPHIPWEKSISISKDDAGNEGIKIAPNMYLCLSYQFSAYKTASDIKELRQNMGNCCFPCVRNNNDTEITTTPSLIRKLFEYKGWAPTKVTIISQYPKDLVEAKDLGVPAENRYFAKDYYSMPQSYQREVLGKIQNNK